MHHDIIVYIGLKIDHWSVHDEPSRSGPIEKPLYARDR